MNSENHDNNELFINELIEGHDENIVENEFDQNLSLQMTEEKLTSHELVNNQLNLPPLFSNSFNNFDSTTSSFLSVDYYLENSLTDGTTMRMRSSLLLVYFNYL